tara:strand:- start:442 stop:828 length:387 start_codon:yes stop_codon:yes gene_type:complete
MASAIPGIVATFLSAADYSATPYRLVYISAADTVTRCAAPSTPAQRPVGIMTDNVGAASGDAVSVQMGGIAKLEAGGTIVVGSAVATDGNGKGVTTTTVADFCVGIALEAAASGGIFSVAIQPFPYTA